MHKARQRTHGCGHSPKGNSDDPLADCSEREQANEEDKKVVDDLSDDENFNQVANRLQSTSSRSHQATHLRCPVGEEAEYQTADLLHECD